MKNRLLLSTLLLFSQAIGAQDVNPFESIGKEGKIITLSNGKYREVHAYDSLQRIGSVVVNMNSGEIYQLLDMDTLYSEATLDPTVISRWYSVDPIIKAHESPYAAFANSPIWIIDPNGADSALVSDSKTWVWDVEKGDTYSSISGRTGVSIDKLREWNKYKDTEIPIGAQLNISDPNQKSDDNPTVSLPEVNLEITKYWSAQLMGEGFIQPWLEIEGNSDFSSDDVEWLQTYETNDPINSYEEAFKNPRSIIIPPHFVVDADKGDGTYPFFDKSPNGSGNFGFWDIPRRTPNQNGTVYWKGNLSLLRKTDAGYVRLVTFSWGFEIHSDGSATTYLLKQTDTPTDFHKQTINELK